MKDLTLSCYMPFKGFGGFIEGSNGYIVTCKVNLDRKSTQ